jgi:tRNA (mo5U34)-methyltransferase
LGDFPSLKWNQIKASIPEDLIGWRVLDVGCNAGFYSIELARRGASVTGIDINSHYLNQARWAVAQFGLQDRIWLKQMHVYDLARSHEEFDLVLFLGVFYHLRYPLLGLDILTRKVKRLMVFQTLTMPGTEVCEDTDGHELNDREVMLESGWPKMAFIEHGFADDITNWWAPNHAAVEAMLRSSGMKVVARPGHEIYLCEPDSDNPSCMTTWNSHELASATGQTPYVDKAQGERIDRESLR